MKTTDLIPQRSPCAAPASCALPVQWRGPAPRLPTQVLSTLVFAANDLVCGAKIHVKIRDINPKLSTALPSLTFSHQTFNLTLTYDLAPRESGWEDLQVDIQLLLRVAVLAAMWLLYLLSPLDLIPEAVFGLVSRFSAMFVKVICFLGWPPG